MTRHYEVALTASTGHQTSISPCQTRIDSGLREMVRKVCIPAQISGDATIEEVGYVALQLAQQLWMNHYGLEPKNGRPIYLVFVVRVNFALTEKTHEYILVFRIKMMRRKKP